MRNLKFFMLLFTVFFYIHDVARADILITPTRVVFEGRDRFAHVVLANTSDSAQMYEINLVHMKMSEGSGTYQLLDEGFEAFDLSKYLVFAPKRVTLAAQSKQKVRLSLRRPDNVPDGDFHVHLKFRSIPVPVLEKSLTEGQASAQVSISISYTIPVVFRSGDVQESAVIGQIDMFRDVGTGKLNVSVPVTRGHDSKYGVLGYLLVYHSVNGKEELVGEISNAHLFPEIDLRRFIVPLRKDITGGELRVVLRHYDASRDIVYADRRFPLQ